MCCREFLKTLPALGLIACVSVGYDGIDVAWCRANGIEVTHARGLNAEDVLAATTSKSVRSTKSTRLHKTKAR